MRPSPPTHRPVIRTRPIVTPVAGLDPIREGSVREDVDGFAGGQYVRDTVGLQPESAPVLVFVTRERKM